jgi:hypothetical protein
LIYVKRIKFNPHNYIADFYGSSLNALAISLDELGRSHPDFRTLQVQELAALQADFIVRPHQPPGEKVLPKLTEPPQGSLIGQDGKTKMSHHAHPTSVICKGK